MQRFLIMFLLLIIDYNSEKNADKIIIDIKDPVNGYRISIRWTPYEISGYDKEEIIGPALLELTKISDGSKSVVKYDSFSLGYYNPSFRINDLETENGYVTSYSNSDISIDYWDLQNILEESFAFYFYDVNFDKKDELIIVDQNLDPGLRENKFYEIKSNGSISKIDETAINSLNRYYQNDTAKGFLNAYFDETNKEISITSSGDYWRDIYCDKLIKDNDKTSEQFGLCCIESHDTKTRQGYDIITTIIPDKKALIKTIKLLDPGSSE